MNREDQTEAPNEEIAGAPTLDSDEASRALARVQQVLDSGLRGRGGAAFPAGIKWRTVRDAAATRKYIVCNADEGDSGTYSDRMLMEGDPYCLIEGMTIAGLAVGASLGYLYLRSEYPHAHRTLQAAIERARAAGWLGAASGTLYSAGSRSLSRFRASSAHRRSPSAWPGPRNATRTANSQGPSDGPPSSPSSSRRRATPNVCAPIRSASTSMQSHGRGR